MTTRREVLAGLSAAGLASLASPAPAAYPAPEQTSIKIGTAVGAMSFMPVYVASAKTWKAQGLDVQLLSFRGDAEVAQALVGDSIDLSVGSLNGVINMISSNQPVIGVYAGFNLAGFSWYAQPAIKTWADARGKAFGVSTFGSTTDALTRYVLRRHGLEPERDVQLIQVGNNASEYAALKANRTQVAILSAPMTWEAQSDGFTLLGSQQRDVAAQWPEHIYSVKTKFLAANPNTLAAVLRGHVAALRFAKANRAAAIEVFEERLKYTPVLAARSYDELMPTFDERGRLPERSMQVFWEILVRNGDVKAPLPESALLDRRFIDGFGAWAPKA